VNAHGEMFIGKPDAGNLLVRFEEGEGNPSLLYTKSANEERLRLHWIAISSSSISSRY